RSHAAPVARGADEAAPGRRLGSRRRGRRERAAHLLPRRHVRGRQRAAEERRRVDADHRAHVPGRAAGLRREAGARVQGPRQPSAHSGLMTAPGAISLRPATHAAGAEVLQAGPPRTLSDVAAALTAAADLRVSRTGPILTLATPGEEGTLTLMLA